VDLKTDRFQNQMLSICKLHNYDVCRLLLDAGAGRSEVQADDAPAVGWLQR
jgi:hypothetical protein